MTHIERLSPHWFQAAQAHLDQLTKPVRSLGRLEEIAARLVAIQQTEFPRVDRKAAFVFAADHGVTAEGVSAYPRAVTEQMVLNFLRGGAAINVLARAAGAKLYIVDVGVDADFNSPALISAKVRRGSRNLRREPALSDSELEAAWQAGTESAQQARAAGVQLVAVGEIGIGNTTAASAITAALTGLPAESVTGPGTGVAGAALAHKTRIVAESVALHFPDGTSNPREILRCLGGLDLAAMTGFILTAALFRLAIVIDGFISTAAAALACSFNPLVRDYIFIGHQSEEAGHQALLTLIGQKPLLNLGMRLGEGTGAVLAFPIIEAAVRIYNEMATFQSAGVSEAL